MVDAPDPEEIVITSAGKRARGERAKIELSLTDEVCAGLRQAMLERVVITPADNTAMINRLINGVQIIDAIRKALTVAVTEGETAKLYDTILDQALTGQGPRQGR